MPGTEATLGATGTNDLAILRTPTRGPAGPRGADREEEAASELD